MAADVLDAPDLTGWYVGYILSFIAITLVVILVATILTMARRIAVQAAAISASLEQSRNNTLPLWDVAAVNAGLTSIVESAQAARGVLGGRL